MNKIHRFIRHEILNIFTVINITLSSKSIRSKEKNEALELIKKASMLVSHENILLGNSPKFLLQENNLTEMIDLIMCIYAKDIQKNKIKIKIPKTAFILTYDSHYVKEAVQSIIKKLISFSKAIDLSFKIKAKELVIVYKSSKSCEIKKKDIIEYLHEHNTNNDEIGFQLALVILQMHKMKYQLLKEKIIITFK